MPGRASAPAVLLSSLLLAGVRQHGSPPALLYTFAPVPGDSAALLIELRINQPAAGPIRLVLPSEWAGQSGLHRAITNLRAATPGDRLTDTDTAWVKILHHGGGAVAVVRYELRQDWNGPVQSPAYHRAIVQRDWSLLVGQNALVLPGERTGAMRSVTFDFGFLPPGWIAGTSYGTGRPRLEFYASVDQLRDIELALGDWRARVVKVGGKPIHVLQRGRQSFSEAGFDSVLKAVVAAERKFWDADPPEHYLITLMPTRLGEFGGTRLNGAFMVAIDSTAPLDARTVRLLAHELFHEWNGGDLLVAAPGHEERLKWFSEGFTDFYSWELARRSRAMTDSSYAAGITDMLRLRGMSSWQDSASAALERSFWRNDEAKFESYRRGAVFALRADRALRDRSRGRKSLDDVMHRLAADSSRTRLTDAIIGAAMIAEGLPDAAQWIADMRSGRPAPLGPGLLGKCFQGEWYSTPRFDLGFDLALSRSAKSVRGVDPRSAAFSAGLRDSMPLLGLSINNGDPGRPATITVAAPDGSRTPITYLPARPDSVTILRFSPRPEC